MDLLRSMCSASMCCPMGTHIAMVFVLYLSCGYYIHVIHVRFKHFQRVMNDLLFDCGGWNI